MALSVRTIKEENMTVKPTSHRGRPSSAGWVPEYIGEHVTPAEREARLLEEDPEAWIWF